MFGMPAQGLPDSGKQLLAQQLDTIPNRYREPILLRISRFGIL